MYFSSKQADQLNQITRDLERRTGVQIIAAVVDKSDAYPEIPWKAFALGSAASALLIWLWQVLQPARFMPLTQLVPILGAGLTAALLTVLWPAFARFFLDGARSAGEVDQYARALFLEREIFNSPSRTGILLLVSLFERRVIILPDNGITGRVDPSALQPVIDRMTALLRRGEHFAAFAEGLALLEATLAAAGFTADNGESNHLSDTLIQRKEDRP